MTDLAAVMLSREAVERPYKRVAALAGFMSPEHGTALFRSFPSVTPSDQLLDAATRWANARKQTKEFASDVADFNADPRGLDAALRPDELRISASPIVRRSLAAPIAIASVKLDSLVTLQTGINLEHVDKLSSILPLDSKSQLQFCLATDSLGMPLVDRDGVTSFSHCRAEDLEATKLSVSQINDHECRLSISITARPNFCLVARWNQRYLLLNGHHRAVALIKAGYTRMFCALTENPDLDKRFADRLKFFSEQTLLQDRPPMVRDFLSASTTVLKPNKETMLQVAFYVNEV